MNIVSSIVAGNTGGSSPDLYDGTTVFNVSNSAIGSTFTQGTVSGNLTTANSTPTLLFGTATPTLANNGGTTDTIALSATSTALDLGSNPGSQLYDQRGTGFNRSSGAGVDIGAFEVQGSTPPVVTTTTGSVTYTEGGPAVAIDAGVTVTNSGNLNQAVVQITTGFVAGQDVLNYTAAALP